MALAVSVASLRNNLADTICEVGKSKDYLLVTKRGKAVSALVNLDFFEDLMALGNKRYLDSIKKARSEIKKGEVFTHEEVFGNL